MLRCCCWAIRKLQCHFKKIKFGVKSVHLNRIITINGICLWSQIQFALSSILVKYANSSHWAIANCSDRIWGYGDGALTSDVSRYPVLYSVTMCCQMKHNTILCTTRDVFLCWRSTILSIWVQKLSFHKWSATYQSHTPSPCTFSHTTVVRWRLWTTRGSVSCPGTLQHA